LLFASPSILNSPDILKRSPASTIVLPSTVVENCMSFWILGALGGGQLARP
jgi:hypothetical protein